MSGHTFILILSTLLILEELSPYLPYFFAAVLPSGIASKLDAVFPARLSAPRNPYASSNPRARTNMAVTAGILSMMVLWLFSMVNTALFFHTPQEKLSGVVVGLAAWAVLPKGG